MEILGLVFAGSATAERAAMAAFVESTLGLRRAPDHDPADSDIFELPDGSRFGVADEREPGGGTSRTIGFLVADLDAAVAELQAAGVETEEPAETDRQRYAHFHAPDGRLYELVQELPC
ncbi:glyoxylase I family protein [Allocatelliglobosispora scoriae]|uniref:Glyoxylase I family protein n=1 Tax=Allocatelliglobosispora scoriae TaxID=643052 RepID=A0A841BJ43_9ACTN|nr:VOC family protein [Allocatelliglobosispora scoriae]MBB5867189.1 glyoxylase I family protein [Allocatelliglobosispora scoriae]